MSLTVKWLIYILAAIILLISFLYYQNNGLGVTRFQIHSDKLPMGFDKLAIVQLSDLHSKSFGKDQRTLLRKVRKLKPDLIMMTGDLIDSRRYNEETALTLMSGLTRIAPVYYVTGNHEKASRKFDGLEKRLIEAGVHVLRNEHEVIPLGDGVIRLIGVDDPTFDTTKDGDINRFKRFFQSAFEGLEYPDAYTILLSHRPESFSIYEKHGIDLSFTGHAHGGQIRLPFLGGIIAPGQGMWPTYYEGMHEMGNSAMIVNRGLGNSSFPQRLFNRPEIVYVELSRSDNNVS